MQKNIKNIKNISTGKVYSYQGMTTNDDGEDVYIISEFTSLRAKYVERTDEKVWIRISFNCRLTYAESKDCSDYIETIGGLGGPASGGSNFEGSESMIKKLLIYMEEKDYDMLSMSFQDCSTATQNRLAALGLK